MSKLRTSRIVLFAVVLLALGTTVFSQTAAPTDGFTGSWQAEFQGKTFLTVVIDKQDGKFTGNVSHSHVELDANGELTAAEARTGNDPIIEATENNKTLKVTTKDQDSQDATSFELKLTGENQAELQFVGMPSGTITPKPWKLTKASGLAAAAATAPTMKQKLAAAAQTWISGQFGTNSSSTMSASTSTPSSDSAVSSNVKTASNSTPAPAPLKLSDAQLDSNLRKGIDALPRRVNDKAENLGDMVNFVIVGSEKDMQGALEAAQWHIADTDNKEAVLKAILQTYQKKDYLAMPMSQLYLFGRIQDFGYEKAEPYSVVASRHHFRIWKAPFTYNDKTVWVGAGTHDIGFEKDQRNGSVTHKIDPAVDGERDNIGRTLQEAGKVKSLTYYLPPSPVQEARNATGGGYHSDGRILVIELQ